MATAYLLLARLFRVEELSYLLETVREYRMKASEKSK